MKVLHISFSDLLGGAAIGTYRQHLGLLKQGIHSKLLVGKKVSDSDLVATVQRSETLETFIKVFTKTLGFNYINHISSFNILKHQFYQEADILNFHNLHPGYFSYLAIPALTEQKPAVFTLRDMWSFTGHCAYSYGCDRFKIGCGKCPNLSTYPKIYIDSTRYEWKLKDWVYSRSNLTIVTPSQWLTEQAQQSMLNRFPIHFIPHGIDTTVYQPLDAEQCRQELGIPSGKKVLMFGAEMITDPRKGGDLLVKALQSLPDALKRELVLLTVGKGGETLSELVSMPIIDLGYVSDEHRMAVAYSAADLFVFPTRADIFGKMLQESMACGTPMVSFNTCGVPDLVRPGVTGYLAASEDVQDLSNGIVQLLEDNLLREQMSQNCRTIALKEYTLELQAQKYIELYQSLL